MRTKPTRIAVLWISTSGIPACSSTQTDSATVDDEGLLVDLPLDLELSPVIPTVVTALWSAEGATTARVEITAPDRSSWAVAADPTDGPARRTPIIGLQPDTAYTFQVFAEVDGQAHSSEPRVQQTGPVSSSLPSLDIERSDEQARHRGFYVTALVAQATAVIFDSDGRYVWWYELDGIEQLGRVRLSNDGRSVLMASVNLDGQEDADIVRVSLDGTEEEHIAAPNRHHDFVELADGGLVYTATSPTELDGRVVAGDVLVERAADGTSRVLYDVTDLHSPQPGSESGGTRWPHANAIDAVDDDTAFLVSFLYMDGIARIDRSTGAEDWFLGGADSDFHDAGGDAEWFDAQHGMQLLGTDILVFDNARASHDSRAVQLSLDLDGLRAEESWSYHPDPAIDTPVMGDVHRFEDGNTLITFSYNGVIEEITADKTVVWRLSTELGGALSWLDWLPRLQDG